MLVTATSSLHGSEIMDVEEKDEVEVRARDAEGCRREITQRRLHLTRLRKQVTFAL